MFINPGYGGSLHIGKAAVRIDVQTSEETDKKVKTLDSINGLNIKNNLFPQVDEICVLCIYNDPVDMVVEDNIQSADAHGS